MNFTLNKKTLLSMLRRVGVGIKKDKNTFSISTNAKELVFILSDLNITNRIKASLICTEGICYVNYQKFVEIISFLKEGEIEVQLEQDNLKITQANSTIHLCIHKDMENGIIEKPVEINELVLNFSDFKDWIKKTEHAAAKKDNFAGIFFELKNKILNIVSLDGRRMSWYKKENIDFEDQNFFVDIDLIKSLSKLDYEGYIKIYSNDNLIFFELDDLIIQTTLLCVNYPNYRHVVPKEINFFSTLRRNDFLINIKQVKPLADNEAYRLVLFFSSDALHLSTRCIEGDGYTLIDTDYKYQGDDLKTSLNSNFVIEALERIDEEYVCMCTSGSDSSILFVGLENKNYINIIMPMKVECQFENIKG